MSLRDVDGFSHPGSAVGLRGTGLPMDVSFQVELKVLRPIRVTGDVQGKDSMMGTVEAQFNNPHNVMLCDVSKCWRTVFRLSVWRQEGRI